jgi:hypothetical protein
MQHLLLIDNNNNYTVNQNSIAGCGNQGYRIKKCVLEHINTEYTRSLPAKYPVTDKSDRILYEIPLIAPTEHSLPVFIA